MVIEISTVKVKIIAENKRLEITTQTPGHINKWSFANFRWHCSLVSNDFKINGSYDASIEANDGRFGF